MKKQVSIGLIGFGLSLGVQAAELDGKWVLQDAGNTQATLDEAVEKVAQEMNFFIRALARPVLKKQTQICGSWTFGVQADQFQWQCDDAEMDEIPLTAQGEVVEVDEEGVEISGTFQQTDDAVVIVLESERGKRTSTWQKVSDHELLYTVKLESEKLPTPLTWTLNYQKD